jgi:hypothetical protein
MVCASTVAKCLYSEFSGLKVRKIDSVERFSKGLNLKMRREKAGKERWAGQYDLKQARVAAHWPRAGQLPSQATVLSADADHEIRSRASGHEGETCAKGQMLKRLCEVGEFVRRFPTRARFGDLSRARLRLLRFEISDDKAECDWVARVQDKWDASLSKQVTEANVSTQALKDAIQVRGLLFSVLPKICSAAIRVYRKSPEGKLELVITGTVNRKQPAPASVRSLTMRSKLLGLKFWIDDGILENLQPEEYAVNS